MYLEGCDKERVIFDVSLMNYALCRRRYGAWYKGLFAKRL